MYLWQASIGWSYQQTHISVQPYLKCEHVTSHTLLSWFLQHAHFLVDTWHVNYPQCNLAADRWDRGSGVLCKQQPSSLIKRWCLELVEFPCRKQKCFLIFFFPLTFSGIKQLMVSAVKLLSKGDRKYTKKGIFSKLKTSMCAPFLFTAMKQTKKHFCAFEISAHLSRQKHRRNFKPNDY